jgi:Uma2 family endonuclease
MRAVILEMPQHWLDERRRSGAERFDEMWEGVLHVSPSPNFDHQSFVLDLAAFLKMHWAKPRGGQAIHEINVVHPADEADWINNYRIPDIVLLSPERLSFNRNTYILGAPLVCVEIRSPRDESYEKLDFYIRLGVPEVWIIDRDTKVPTLFELKEGEYREVLPNADGWFVSAAVGARMLPTPGGQLAIRLDSGAAAEVPD